jgi:hypothetical protein
MALFRTTKVFAKDDDRSVIVEGKLESGQIQAGMELKIPLSGTFSMSVPVCDVLSDGAVLVLDCEDHEGVEFVLAMNFSDELLEIAVPD